MPLILKNKSDRFTFQFGNKSALRSTSELVDQLQDQLQAQRDQHRFDLAEKKRDLAAALRELAEARYELARRDRIEAFAHAPSPSAMLH
jgi:excinuclease UvrABC nuclease subunit